MGDKKLLDFSGTKNDLKLLADFGKQLDTKLPPVRHRGKTSPVETPTVREALMRELLKIRNRNRRLVWLIPNRAQAEYESRCTKQNIVLKSRQMGITTHVAARFFIQTITQPGTMTVQVAHDQDSAEEIFKIVHRFWENLPKALQEGALKRSRANIRQLVFPALDSEYRVETAADPHAGRGLTIHHLHCSEVARWPRGGTETLASLRSAVPPDGEVVLESTPNGAAGVFYEEWQLALETGYRRHFFPWWYEATYAEKESCGMKRLSEDEERLMKLHQLSLNQVAWRRKNWSMLRGLAPQEFAEDAQSCFLASGECVFEVKTLLQRVEECPQPLEMQENQRLLIWLPPQEPHQYIVGVDPAGGGTGGDYACAQVIDRTTGMQCAELLGHYPPRELADRVAKLGRAYNDALIAVERNNHGHAVLAHLVDGEHCKNIYEEGSQLGWLTSAASRPAMIENFVAILVAEPKLFHSKRLLGECRTFVRHENGETAAAAGSHDDCVMAMAVALAVRRAVAGNLQRVGRSKH